MKTLDLQNGDIRTLADTIQMIKDNEMMNNRDPKKVDDELEYYLQEYQFEIIKGEKNTMRKLKLEVYNNTTENIVERFEITELKQAVKLATDQAYSEKEHYTIELLGEIDSGYDTLGTYELDEVDELQRELERLVMKELKRQSIIDDLGVNENVDKYTDLINELEKITPLGDVWFKQDLINTGYGLDDYKEITICGYDLMIMQ